MWTEFSNVIWSATVFADMGKVAWQSTGPSGIETIAGIGVSGHADEVVGFGEKSWGVLLLLYIPKLGCLKV